MTVDINSLNPRQREAVTHIDGPVLVLAGAGSGKTRVITVRIAYLIERGVRPENILGVTFTNKAAGEMRERVAGTIGPELARRVNLSTFHALGARILREDIEHLGYGKRFTILDEGDRVRVVKQVLKELNLSGTGMNEGRLLWIVSRAKNAMTTPARLPEAKYNPEMPRAQRVFDLYNRALVNLNAVDFDDLLLLPVRLMKEHPDVRDKYRHRFRYVMVDEYQDTNPIQLELLEQLVAPPKHNLMVVGDDDQSIYGFRGAVADNILRFERLFDDTRVVTLDQNYRSVGTILDAANSVIANNRKRKAKKLWSDLGTGRPVQSIAFDDAYTEAKYIAGRIAGQSKQQGRPLHHFAVLYRSNAQSRVLEEAFRAARVPYRMLGGKSLFDRKDVRDVIAYARLVLNPADELALRRVINYPTRAVGTKTVADLDAHSRRTGTPLHQVARNAIDKSDTPTKARDGLRHFFAVLDETRAQLRGQPASALRGILDRMLDRIGIERAILASEKNAKVARVRWRIVTELLEGIDNATGDGAFARLDDYVQRASLDDVATNKDEEDVARGKATLLTLHSSKGLEFPIVFMVGMNDGLLPHRNALESSDGVPEERRLCYVGMTRAREELILTRARFAVKRNERLSLKPSRFLTEIPGELITESAAAARTEDDVAQDNRNEANFEAIKALLNGKS